MRFTFLLCFLVFLTACEILFEERVCTDAGCSDAYSISFNLAADSSALGTYEVELAQEGQPSQLCRFTITATGNQCRFGGCFADWECDDPRGVGFNENGDEVVVYFPKIDGELQILIRQDGELLVDKITTPVYEAFYPNGPRCEPKCAQASETVVIR